MAKLRYERMLEERQQQEIQAHNQQLDASMDAASAQSTDSAAETRSSAEPYILSGYEALAKREYDEQVHLDRLEAQLHRQNQDQGLRESTRYNQAVDPVYKAGSGLWGKDGGGLQDMENQYGAFEQMREYGAGTRVVTPVQCLIYGDDEMVM